MAFIRLGGFIRTCASTAGFIFLPHSKKVIKYKTVNNKYYSNTNKLGVSFLYLGWFGLAHDRVVRGARLWCNGSKPGPEVIKLFSCSTQLSMEFFLLINVKMPTIVGILTFMSGKNSILGLSEPKKSRSS